MVTHAPRRYVSDVVNSNNFDSSTIQNSVSQTQYIGGTTNIADGLRQLNVSIYNTNNGARSGFPDLAYVVLGGTSNTNSDQVLPIAYALKSRGVQLVVVGISNQTSMAEMQAIASYQSDIYQVPNYGSLAVQGFTDVLVGQTCPTSTGGLYFCFRLDDCFAFRFML